MNCRKNCSFFVKALLFTGLFLASVLLVSNLGRRETKTGISYDEAIARLNAGQIREINLDNQRMNLLDYGNIKYRAEISEKQKIELLNQGSSLNIAVTFNDDPPPLFFLFQILFWLFFISPPVIVVLLLVIIKKLDAKK